MCRGFESLLRYQIKDLMIISQIQELKETIPNNQRILALDLGSKKIGIAISDSNQFIASPFKQLIRSNFKKDQQFIKDLISEHEVCSLIIGFPYQSNNIESKNSADIKNFAKQFLEILNIPIYFQDESFSTKFANSALKEYGFTRKKANKIDDKIAACYILQNFLEEFNQ